MEKEQQYEKLFVGGDLSGIQKFLYNISSTKAAVSLIGRSAYLRKYMEDVCQHVTEAVQTAGAENVDVIYCSGGKFYLITDNTERTIQAIDNVACREKEMLWKEHLGQLGISISYVAFTEYPDGTIETNGENRQKPGILWKTVNDDFARQKKQKFKTILEQDYTLFQPIPVGGNVKVCAITGVESSECVVLDDKDKDKIYVLPSVKRQILEGERQRQEHGFKTFEEYAQDSYLGILRMDVDGLGKRFVDGFSSIAQYKAFSKRLVDFFEKEVRAIQQEEDFRDYLNIIYAGGDDLFVVGRWDKTIDFAERIHNETAVRFKDESISISGGVAVVKPKFPISKAAEMAGDAELAAKQYNDGEKNAFHMLGMTVSWNREFDYVKQFKQQFLTHINSPRPLSKSVLHKIMLYASIADMNKERERKGEAKDYSYLWHMVYYLTRQMEKYKKDNPAVWEFCRKLRDEEISSSKARNLELLALAARWAELLEREKNNNK